MDYTICVIIVVIIPVVIIFFSFIYLIKYRKINVCRLFNENDKSPIDIKTKIIVLIIAACLAMLCGGLKGILNIKENIYNLIWAFIFSILLYCSGTILTKK